MTGTSLKWAEAKTARRKRRAADPVVQQRAREHVSGKAAMPAKSKSHRA